MNKHNSINAAQRKNRKKRPSGKKTSESSKQSKRKNRIFQETSFDSNEESDYYSNYISRSSKKTKLVPHDFEKVSELNESNPRLFLTPSKSECESTESFISDFEVSNISCNLTDDNFGGPSSDSNSYSYDNIINEFINTDVDDNVKLSYPTSNVKKETHIDVTINEKNSTAISPSLKKSKDRKIKNYVNDNEVGGSSSPNLSSNSLNKTPQYQYTNDGIVLVLDKNETIHFYGLLLLSVLHGEVEVLGHIITNKSQDVKLYSPRGTSLLYIKNVTKLNLPVTNYLLNLKAFNKSKFAKNCAVVLCKILDDPNILFIEKHMSQQILPKNDNLDVPRVVFQPEGNWNFLNVNHSWDEVIDKIDTTTKMMVCGGKGVGKTTFIRYAINKLLMKFSEIRVIDLDPGQCEFTIPGCISIVKIDKPIFGVNYTHLKTAERSILSNINIAYEPDRYIAGVQCLLNTTLDAVPTLINYMGYTHGIGINILSAVIMHVQPTDILQIQSHNSKKNYKHKLSCDVVKQNAKLFVHNAPTDLNYNLHQLESMSDENDGWSAEPRQLREMCILSYISQMIDSNSIFKTKLPMYRIDLTELKISDLKGEIVHPSAVNACLVGLCSVEEHSTNTNIFQCFGWGIVRGIDMASNTLLLLTSEKLETLEKVTHLVLNNASLPPSIYMTPDEVIGPMPYVIEGVLMSFGQIPKRSRISVKNTG